MVEPLAFEKYPPLEQNQTLIAYKGDFSENLFGCLLELSENKLEKFEKRVAVKKKVYNIIIEIIQNIYHHFEKFVADKEGNNTIIFVLKKNSDTYSIHSGNHIHTSMVPFLKNKIDRINEMTSEELKTHYLKKLKEGMISPEGEGGLGIMDICRKSKYKLLYDFEKIDRNFTFFSLEVKISA